MHALQQGGVAIKLSKKPFYVWVAVLIAVDQLSKAYIRETFALREQQQIIPGVLEIFHTQNEGIAFGLLPGAGVWLAPVAIIVAIAAGVTYHRQVRRDRVLSSSMILLAAGALGNFIDRVAAGGKVTDFINIYIIHVFNVADACITVGTILLVLHWMLDARHTKASRSQ